jgi:DDE superfamily endonuclease
VLRHPYRPGKQISMCGLLAYRPGPGDLHEVAVWIGFDLIEALTPAVICLLDGLGRQLSRHPVTVIWDSLGAHHVKDLHAWTEGQPWLEVKHLSAHAPELNPVEGLWANLKGASWPTAAAPIARS